MKIGELKEHHEVQDFFSYFDFERLADDYYNVRIDLDVHNTITGIYLGYSYRSILEFIASIDSDPESIDSEFIGTGFIPSRYELRKEKMGNKLDIVRSINKRRFHPSPFYPNRDDHIVSLDQMHSDSKKMSQNIHQLLRTDKKFQIRVLNTIMKLSDKLPNFEFNVNAYINRDKKR